MHGLPTHPLSTGGGGGAVQGREKEKKGERGVWRPGYLYREQDRYSPLVEVLEYYTNRGWSPMDRSCFPVGSWHPRTYVCSHCT